MLFISEHSAFRESIGCVCVVDSNKRIASKNVVLCKLFSTKLNWHQVDITHVDSSCSMCDLEKYFVNANEIGGKKLRTFVPAICEGNSIYI